MKKGSVIFAVAFAMICVSVFGIFEFVNADNISSEKRKIGSQRHRST